MSGSSVIVGSEDGWEDCRTLGGKGANLRYLGVRGFPVPPWFCLPFEQFDTFVAPFTAELERLTASLGDASAAEFERTSAAIRELLSPAELPAPLRDVLEREVASRRARSYSVRSSGAQEDSGALSFAGMFETYLNVRPADIADHVRRCWLSAFNPNALRYMGRNGVSPAGVRMAVVVQEMVRSEKAGVLFQANPRGALNEVAIIAGYGLGEGIVSGRVEADTIYYDRVSRQTRSVVATKRDRLEYGSRGASGVETVPVEASLRDRPVLGGEELDALLAMSRKLEAAFSTYQDVEWAFDRDGALWLLQSRPITTIPDGRLQLFDNSNITESYPGISSPLTFSFVREVYERWFFHACLACGYPRRVLERQAAFGSLVEQIEGRIYYNMTSWYDMMSILPLASSLAIPSFEDAIGTSRSKPAGGRNGLSYYKGKALALFALKFVFYGRFFDRYKNAYDRFHARTRRALDACGDDRQLMGLLSDFMERLFPIAQFGRVSDTYLMIALLAIKTFLKRRGLDDEAAGTLINGLLVGERDLESVKPVRSLRSLAGHVARHPALKEAIAAATSWDRLAAELEVLDRPFLLMVREHLELYGDRTIGELKLETETFRQAPLALMGLIAAAVAAPPDQAAAERVEQEIRDRAEARVREVLPRMLDRRIAWFLIGNLRRLVRSREYVRLNRSRYFGLVRTIFRRVADSWVRDGVLERAEDIFFLTRAEIAGAAGNPDGGALRAAVAARRAEWHGFARRRPANRLWLKGDVAKNVIPQVGDDGGAGGGAGEDAGVLKGIGCGPGRVTAETVVLLTPDYAADVAGKIIVSENTDPGWVFLIMNASGLVMEKGSLLSHTAIIGRELGIPTVVGVRNATTRIRSSVMATIDGSAGTVELNPAAR